MQEHTVDFPGFSAALAGTESSLSTAFTPSPGRWAAVGSVDFHDQWQAPPSTGHARRPRPEAVRRLPDDTATDCELIVWEAGRLAFERLQQRMHRRGAAAARAAVEFPAHLIAFDLLRVHDRDLTGRPFSERYAALRRCSLRRGCRRRGHCARPRPTPSRCQL
ncbi:hypothetical protein [Streptomyces sp. NPDC001652]|uniref:ATP-dependent DNA ligase n=1 Tax=Streptomyces sp. NPDC001652 TaxID=3154393 RepID=UPI00332C3635